MSLELYKQSYLDRVEYLAGDQHKAILPSFISQSEKFGKKGETIFTDGIRPLDPANAVDLADYATYKRLSEAAGGGALPDYATYLQSLTDHKRILEQRSALVPKVVDWARWFDTEDEVGQFLDPKAYANGVDPDLVYTDDEYKKRVKAEQAQISQREAATAASDKVGQIDPMKAPEPGSMAETMMKNGGASIPMPPAMT